MGTVAEWSAFRPQQQQVDMASVTTSAVHHAGLAALPTRGTDRHHISHGVYGADDASMGLVRMAQAELDIYLRRLAQLVGCEPVFAEAKSIPRAMAKADREFGGDLSRVTDWARGTLVCDDLAQVFAAWQLIDSTFEVLQVENRFRTPKANGYRDLNVLVRLRQSGVVAEFQVHVAEIYAVKSGPEHRIYEEIQRMERVAYREGRGLSPRERAAVRYLRARSQQLYAHAWSRAVGAATI
ncbi:MAG: RelA/SpoT domain-containing protein [Myxococcota bacterium]